MVGVFAITVLSVFTRNFVSTMSTVSLVFLGVANSCCTVSIVTMAFMMRAVGVRVPTACVSVIVGSSMVITVAVMSHLRPVRS